MGRSELGRIWPAPLLGNVIVDQSQAWAAYPDIKRSSSCGNGNGIIKRGSRK